MKPTVNPWKKCLEFVALSDIGLRRSNNQDSHDEVPARNQTIWNSRGHVFCVADGMGAHAAGELASKLATDTIPMVYLKQTQLPPGEALTRAIQEANQVIHRKGNSDPELRGMGTTNDTLVILPEGAMIGHVGDSRIYRLRGRKWEQLTRDHSVVWDMEEAGKPIDETVQKNVITRCLGVSPDVRVDIEGPMPIQQGDIFLLCSDGLCGQFEGKEADMGRILSILPLPEATQGLVDLANLYGGPDNITVTTVKYLGPQQAVKKNGEAEPVAPAAQTQMPRPAVPVWIWNLLAGTGLLLFLGLILLGFWPMLGLVLAVPGAAGAGFAAFRIFGRKPLKPFSRRSGKGPYRSYSAECDAEFCRNLRKTFSELRSGAVGQGVTELQEAEKLARTANRALEEKKFDESAKHFVLAISSVWRALAG